MTGDLRSTPWFAPAGALLTLVALTASCGSDPSGPGFVQTVLVANSAGRAPITDPNLLNPWGLARSTSGPWWVVDNQAGVATVYDGEGNRLPLADPLVVSIPPPAGSPPGTQSLPTGIVFNDTDGFLVSAGPVSGPAHYIFATEDGTIAAWSDAVSPNAILAVDNSSAGAVYRGLAIGRNAGGSLLYATNFAARTVDVFDRTFAPATLSGSFTDPGIPAAFAPFGIQNVDGDLFVSYARRNATTNQDVPGVGNGYVNVFDTDGQFVRRFASQGRLNSPWGIAQAPVSFGAFGGALIIGNAGDGQLNAFNPVGGTFLGQVSRPNGDPITISGLWGLAFGNGSVAGSTDTLYFAAGSNDRQDGVFGTLVPSGQ